MTDKYKLESKLPIGNAVIHYHGETIESIQAHPEFLSGKILDIGCASGYHLYVAAENNRVKEAIGLDINHTKIEHAETLRRDTHQSDNKVTFVCGCVTELTKYFSPNEFDAIGTFHTFEHWYPEDYDLIFEQIKLILKPDGYLMIIVPDGHCHDSLDQHHSWWSASELQKLFESYQFETIKCGQISSGQILGIFKNRKVDFKWM